MSETEFLAQQAAAAQAAMAATWHEIKQKLGQSANLKPLLKNHPWMLLGGATIAGFAAASTLVPSKEEQALKKLAAIERALRTPHENAHNGDGKEEPAKPGMLSMILREAVGGLRPILMSLLTAGLQGQQRSQPPVDPQYAPGDPAAQYGNDPYGMPPGAAPGR